MKTLEISGSEDTPAITFSIENKQYSIIGRSLPEDVVAFYKPVLKWMDDFASNPIEGSHFIFKLYYFNTASSKIIQEIILKLDRIFEAGNDIKILWYYDADDEDIIESGKEFKDMVSIPFDMLPY